jgi:FemAB-related protein (PEP-CTERM system-associated)
MEIQVEKISDADAAAWDEYVLGTSGASHYHLYAWHGFFADYLDKETWYLAAREGTRITGILPLVRQKSRVFGDYLVSLPFLNYAGILADDERVADALADECALLAQRTGVSHAELREYRPRARLVQRDDKVAMRRELPDSADALSAALGAKLRSQIRRPTRDGASTRRGGVELLDDFYRVFSRNMRDLGTPVYAKSMFADILSRFPGDIEIVLVDLDDQSVAAGFLVHFRGRTEVPWASADRRYNRLSVNMLLYWDMLCAAIDHGSSEFDFGRSTRDSGPHRFKKQWGAKEVPLVWNYWLREGESMPNLGPDNPVYSLAIRAWQKLPLSVANALGPMLVRNLP